jgi:hypothetical protein
MPGQKRRGKKRINICEGTEGLKKILTAFKTVYSLCVLCG